MTSRTRVGLCAGPSAAGECPGVHEAEALAGDEVRNHERSGAALPCVAVHQDSPAALQGASDESVGGFEVCKQVCREVNKKARKKM